MHRPILTYAWRSCFIEFWFAFFFFLISVLTLAYDSITLTFGAQGPWRKYCLFLCDVMRRKVMTQTVTMT
ncbi:uncharacterized protein BDV14DRAFT_168725 [Aspergillus stella-maris]|uniref:uncharacterized protein n=1 Tax=Aspergillus stella-maris TaxID=1810926 RepID=UPI003CCCC914